MKKIHDDISKANSVLKDGGIIIYPTDTVWGIGCDATVSLAIITVITLTQHRQQRVYCSNGFCENG